jgi:hypothetical protein
MKLTVTEIAVHREDQSPIFGDLTTHVSVADEGGGIYVRITQDTDDGPVSIRMDFNEVDHWVQAINILKSGVQDDL